jgi:hypothetical protein
MFEHLDDAIAVIREAVTSTALKDADARDAVRFFDAFAELDRLASAGQMVAGRRVEQTRAWHGSGFPNPAAWAAARKQTTLGAAIAMLETGRRLDALPATRDEFVSGALSAQQAQEIAAAAAVDPAAEGTLLASAQDDSVTSLRQQCRQVIAASIRSDPNAEERIQRGRYVRFWTDADGSRRMDGRFAPAVSAGLESFVEARSIELRDQARAAGSPERLEAYAADALIGLLDASGSAPKSVVNVHIDFDAWVRGHLERGEECSIEGVGPVSVDAVRRLADDAYIRAVLEEGSDVRAIATVGRPIPARLRAALEARDQTCVVPGCDNRKHLEIHHIIPICEGGLSCMENCCRLCLWHHMLITRRYWRIEGKPGDWRWVKVQVRSRDGPP